MQTDWKVLAAPEAHVARRAVTEKQLIQAAGNFIRHLKDELDQERDRILAAAHKEADIYHQEHQGQRPGDTARGGYFSTRVRLLDNTLQATWHQNRFVPLKTGKWKLYSTHLKKGANSTRYPQHAFSNARDWEQALIENVEDRYERLRKRSAALSRLRAAAGAYEKLLQAAPTDYQESSL